MPLKSAEEFFNPKSSKEEQREDYVPARPSSGRLKSVGDLFPKKEVVKFDIEEDVVEKEENIIEKPTEPINVSVNVPSSDGLFETVFSELSFKADQKDIISLRESLEKYFDVLENKINTLDIRIYDEDIASLNDELGKLSKDVTNNLRSYSETTDDTFDKVQQEFGASISYIKNSLQEISNKEENDLNEVKELHSQLKKIVEDIPNSSFKDAISSS